MVPQNIKAKMKEWSVEKQRKYLDAFNSGDMRTVAAMTGDIKGSETHKGHCRAYLALAIETSIEEASAMRQRGPVKEKTKSGFRIVSVNEYGVKSVSCHDLPKVPMTRYKISDVSPVKAGKKNGKNNASPSIGSRWTVEGAKKRSSHLFGVATEVPLYSATIFTRNAVHGYTVADINGCYGTFSKLAEARQRAADVLNAKEHGFDVITAQYDKNGFMFAASASKWLQNAKKETPGVTPFDDGEPGDEGLLNPFNR